METKYSKKPFKGYTHRFIVEFEADELNLVRIDIYSNSNSHKELSDYIEKKKTERVLNFQIAHSVSKEQDEATEEMINEFIENL